MFQLLVTLKNVAQFIITYKAQRQLWVQAMF